MEKITIAIGPSSFGKASSEPLDRLRDAGVLFRLNPYGRTLNEAEIREHLQGVDGLIAGLEPLNESVLSSCPQLKAIARVGTGMDNVDTLTAERLAIKVSNTPDAPTEAVAEMTIAALLSIGRGIIPANQSLHAGKWKKTIGFGLNGLRVLVVGFGRIGRKVCEHLNHFQANVMVADPFVDPSLLPPTVTPISMKEGLRLAEVVSIHVSGSEEILGSAEFELMTRGAIVLNCSRGSVVNEPALIQALESGVVAGGWLDVFAEEPYHGKLQEYPQMILTPHMCSYSRQCRVMMETQAVENLLRDLHV